MWTGVKIGDNELERRVTDKPTNRFVHIPNPAGPEVETVLDNISCRVNTVAKAYLYISKKV